jgi:hypothetical protein
MSLPSIINKNTPLDDSSFVKKTDIFTSSQSIPFWTENPNILFHKDHILEFYPSENMTYNQKLNTISRVVFIISLILFFITQNGWVLVVAGMTLGSIIILHNHTKNKDKPKHKEGYENPSQVLFTEENGRSFLPKSAEIFQTPDTKNPFSNVLIPDYEYNPNKKTAPPTSSQTVSDDILNKAKILVQEQNPGQPDIANKLFKDMNEELNFEQSMRPFYSTANTTIPNDQGGFADFCYGNSISCKEGNLFACARQNSHYTLY